MHGFLAAHGLHGFLAAHGLHGFLAAHGLHGFLAAHGLQGLHAAYAGPAAGCIPVPTAMAATPKTTTKGMTVLSSN